MSKKTKEYPLYEVKPFGSIKEMLAMAADEDGDKAAYKFRKNGEIKTVTFSEFRNETLALGTGIASLGLADKHVACLGENSYRWIVTYLTMLSASGVYVPVDKELPLADIITVLNHSESELLFYSAKYEEKLKANRDAFPNIKYFIGFDRTESEGEFLSYDEVVAKGQALLEAGNTDFTSMQTDHYGMKMLVYTSGTTGMAKGVMLSEHNIASIVYYGLQVATIFDVGLSVLPYNHTYEAVAGLLVAIHHRSTLCINENLKTVLKNLNEYKPDYIYLVPAFAEVFYKKIWATAKQKKQDTLLKTLIKTSNGLRKMGIDMRRTLFKSVIANFGGNLREIVCGGAPIRPEIGEFFDSIGIPLLGGYGITECSPLVSVNRFETNDFSTAGTVLPCCEVRIDKPDENGEGEILVKGDIVMLGYYKNPELTAEVLVDGWFYTGDFGKFNENNLLMITGRKKNLIVLSNGKNVFPEEIENYIQSIPYVTEVTVYSLKDSKGLESALAAEVYCDPERLAELGITELEATIKEDVKKNLSQLPSYKQIARIYIRDEAFEKTTTNKIKRSSVKFKDTETI